MTIDRLIREEARLVILRAIGEQTNETLNSSILEQVLAQYGIFKPRAWVHGEMSWLAEMGAITSIDAGSVKVGRLTELGRRHLDRHTAIEGVKRPSREA